MRAICKPISIRNPAPREIVVLCNRDSLAHIADTPAQLACLDLGGGGRGLGRGGNGAESTQA